MTQMVAAALAMLLLIGAWQKLRDVAVFGAALAAYELLPAALVGVVAWVLPVLEAVAGLTLVIDRTRPLGVALTTGLLVIVTGAVIVNLLRGRTDLNCGCGGIEDEQTLSWALVVRNAGLLSLVALCAVTPAARALLWLDYVSVAAGAGCLYGLYAMGNQLVANQPRLMRLRSLP